MAQPESGRSEQSAISDWWLAFSESAQCADPGQARSLSPWIPAVVPGTAAEALRRNGQDYHGLDDQDVWYRGHLRGQGAHLLRFAGLATLAEVWCDDRLILTSRSMFLTHDVEVQLDGDHALWICFRALNPVLEVKGPRAKWRPRMIPRQGLRLVRTTLMGRMPGWTPEVDIVGPWRPIGCLPLGAATLGEFDIKSGFENGRGVLTAKVVLDGALEPPVLVCDGRRMALSRLPGGGFGGTMTLSGIRPWWPHTHGDQPLYSVGVEVDDQEISLGRTGFRSLQVDRGDDGKGFGLLVNGIPIFCRGAGWTSLDPLAMSGEREAYEPRLRLARDGGMNMLRMSGTGTYESPAFYQLCDELGLLVWQDFMFANFDYPISDPEFAETCTQEAAQFLSANQLSPCLAVLCGGSEVQQQAAMMGMKPETWASPLFDDILPSVSQAWRPDLPYVVNSPSGGGLPFVVDEGVGHYYGVGAYMRPLEDARRANVRFASECLAFANLPQPSGDLAADLALVTPRDIGADWDFADVRDHYLGLIYGVDSAGLRKTNPLLYLDLSRAVTGQVMEQVFAEWRRSASSCRGALVWTFQDVMAGAGWGVLDGRGEPKPAWYALKRAFQSVQVAVTDEGVNGLALHLTNETADEIEVELELTCLRESTTPVVSVRHAKTLPARSVQQVSAFELIGRFFDITYAYRFGPPGHDVTVVRLRDGDGKVVSEAFHFPVGRDSGVTETKVEASLSQDDQGWVLTLETHRLIQSVHIADVGFRPDDDWFDLAPGYRKVVRLHARDNGGRPKGQVFAPGGRLLADYSPD